MERLYRTQYGKDPPSYNATRRWLEQFPETGIVLQLQLQLQLHRKCWRTLGGKLNTAWTSYVPLKGRMLNFLIVCSKSINNENF
jgi:hypothetical protein